MQSNIGPKRLLCSLKFPFRRFIIVINIFETFFATWNSKRHNDVIHNGQVRLKRDLTAPIIYEKIASTIFFWSIITLLLRLH